MFKRADSLNEFIEKNKLKDSSELSKLRAPHFKNESQEYAEARRKLLAKEIDFRRHMTWIAEQRKALPQGPIVEKNYRFNTENKSDVGLIDLFGNKDTLLVYFWMSGPERELPCPMCSNWLSGVSGNALDLAQRLSFKVLGRNSIENQKKMASIRGFQNLDFVQVVGDAFPKDLRLVDDEKNEMPGIFVFTKDGEQVRLFYGMEMPLGAADPGQDPRVAPDIAPLWSLLDLTPEGREKDWYPQLEY